MKVTIIGVQKGKSRNNRDFTNLFFSQPFTDYEASNGSCNGFKVGTEFTYLDVNVKPGDECEFTYEKGFQDRATLANVTVLKPAKA